MLPGTRKPSDNGPPIVRYYCHFCDHNSTITTEAVMFPGQIHIFLTNASTRLTQCDAEFVSTKLAKQTLMVHIILLI